MRANWDAIFFDRGNPFLVLGVIRICRSWWLKVAVKAEMASWSTRVPKEVYLTYLKVR